MAEYPLFFFMIQTSITYYTTVYEKMHIFILYMYNQVIKKK